MPHCCPDEILMFMAMLPFIGAFFRKLHVWWHNKFNHKCHHKIECQENHLEHTEPSLNKNETLDFTISKIEKSSEKDLYIYDDNEFNPYTHDTRITYVSKEDIKYLAKEPLPLKILYPVEIEEEEE